jgi:hypothetical protein
LNPDAAGTGFCPRKSIVHQVKKFGECSGKRRERQPDGSSLRQKGDFVVPDAHNYLTDGQKLRCTDFAQHQTVLLH